MAYTIYGHGDGVTGVSETGNVYANSLCGGVSKSLCLS